MKDEIAMIKLIRLERPGVTNFFVRADAITMVMTFNETETLIHVGSEAIHISMPIDIVLAALERAGNSSIDY